MSRRAELRTLLDGTPLEVAPRLLGAVLRHGAVAVRVSEVEAYAGSDDPGSHAYRGPTPRNAVMFGPAGRLYCYLIYGLHVCANVTVGPPGSPGAVLLRAGEVVAGVETARVRRPGSTDRDLARGPARLCRALGVILTDDGADLATGPITLTPGPGPAAASTGPRVGLREAPDRPWRFWATGDPTVSAYRPSRHPPRGSGAPPGGPPS